MGSSQSKEEVIIAQTGNSGTTTTISLDWQIKDFLNVAFIILIIFFTIWKLIQCCKKKIEKKIRLEVVRSREQI